MAESARYKKKKSIIWATLAGVVVAALALVSLLPTLVSTQWGENKMKQVINARLPGVLDFESLSLSWFSGIKGRAISYDNRQHGIVVEVAELSTAKGLLALAVSRKELGSIAVKTPVASVYLQEKAEKAGAKAEDPSAQVSQVPAETTQGTAGTLPDKPAEYATQLMLPPLNGDIAVSDGALHVFYPDSREAVLFKDLALQARFDGSDKRLEYQLAFQSGDGAGQVMGSGAITLPAGGNSTLEEINAQAELEIGTWEIADLLYLLNHTADAPTGSGELNGRLSLSGSEATTRQLKGTISAQQLKLQGGPLKSDTPSFDSIALEVDAAQMDGTMNINRLTLTSALATAALSGTLESQGNTDIAGTAEIDLKQLFAQFPGSLNLKEGTSISNGRVDLSMKVRAAGTETHFEGSALLDQLQGAAGGKKLAWDTPVRLEARGAQRSEGLQLDNFTIQSAFLNGTGQGDINQMKVQLSADIGEAMTEIEKFIQLDGWKSNGKMTVNLQVETKSADLRSAAAVVGISDFLLQHNDTIIVPRHTFTANMVSDLRLDQKMQPQEMLNTAVDFASVVGDGSIKLATFLPASGQTSLQLEGLDAAVSLNLKNLTSLLQATEALPQDTRLAGQARIEAQGSLKQNQLQLDHAQFEAAELLVSQGSRTAQEQQVKLTTAGTIHLEERNVALETVNLKSSSGSIAVSGLSVADWADLTKPIQATVKADLDLARVSTLIGNVLPEQWAGSGKLVMEGEITPQEQHTTAVAGNMVITDFALKKGQQTLVPKGDVIASVSSQLDMGKAGSMRTLRGAKLNYKSFVGAGQINLERLELAGAQKQPAIEDLVYAGSVDLSALSDLLKTVGVLPEDSRLAGIAAIDTQLSLEAGRLALNSATVNAADLLFQKGGQTLTEKKMQLTTRGSLDLEKKAAALKPFELQATTGNIAFAELVVNDWSNLQKGIKTKGSINLELGKLAVFLADILPLPEGTTITGQTTLTIDADLSDAKQQFVKIGGLIEPFELSLPDKKTLSEKKIELMIDLNGDVSEQTFAINKIEIASSPVSLEANGTINPQIKEHVLVAQGALKLDLEALSGSIRSLSESTLEMNGISDIPFSIKATSLDGKWVEIPKRSEIVTTFHADTIRGSGLLVESLEVPIKLADGIAEIDIKGMVNKGKMSLQPAIDFSADSPLISIPENNLVLAGVGLSEDMSRDLLAQVHPIFAGAAVSQGTLDLGLGYFNWPIRADERKKATFSSMITFNEVKLRAGGLLTPLLEIMKVDEREITIGDQPMECIGENDRIRCSPLEILVKDHALLFSGSIGFDKSLDYIAQIPVTQRMVGADAYKYLEGTSISVPIGGTISKPAIKKDVVQAALKDLVIQAGKKQITDQAGKLLQNLFKK